jgi:hypothetical protein
MSPPFSGKRHNSWLSDTVIFATVFVVVLVITALTDYLNGQADPPAYLVGLCGAAGSALFGAASSDKSKREREVSDTANRAESKADDALGRSDASMDTSLARVLDVQERELAANRAALQLMHDAVEVKESTGVPVLPETLTAISQLERQTDLLADDIHKRRAQINNDIHHAQSRETETRDIANRAEAKADDALSRSDASVERETEWSQHRDHAGSGHDDAVPHPHVEGDPPC